MNAIMNLPLPRLPKPNEIGSGMVRIPGIVSAGILAAATSAGSDMLDATTHVSLGTAFTVGGIVMGGVWWFGRKFQEIQDRDAVVKLALESKDEKLEALEKRVASLACQNPKCAENNK